MKTLPLGLTLALLTLRLIAQGAPVQLPPGSAADASDRVFTERLRTIADRDATDCGNTPQDTVAICGLKAFQDHKPFFLGYYNRYGTVLGFAYGLAADSDRRVFSVTHQSIRPFPAVAPDRHTQLADDNHTRIAECIKPVKLAKNGRGVLGCVTPVNQPESEKVAHQTPMSTTVCAIVKDPSAFNNKLVRVRGHYSGNFEYSMLSGDGCKDALWFGYGGEGGGPPSLAIYVSGGARSGSEDVDGKRISPVPIKLIRDSKFDRFEKQVKAMANADASYEKKHPGYFISHCVTATFVGRVDSVTPEVHAFRKNHSSQEPNDGLGFGQIGLFEAQLILRSVDDDATLRVCSQ
ncbi:MAG TPA: hypothetical protein VGK01_10975 [Candidatus Angelobacter sp.]|jgi:hypothetical protein